MRAALPLAWVAPAGKEDSGASAGDDVEQEGNGHPAASTILVVEDEILIRLAVCDFLRECGYRVLEASSAEEAQEIFRAGEPIEILFSDVNLAGELDGFALATWVREHHPDIRIMLTSGIATMTQEARGLCDAPFLRKPYAHSDLAGHLERLLRALGRRGG